ncbi:MAG: DUF3857 and transglutaminase domain-containing protein [Bacteroidota bacterium]
MKTIILIITTLIIQGFISYVNSQADMVKKSGNASKYPGSNQLVIYDSTIVDVKETGLSYVSNHSLYKILTYEGAKQLSVIKFDYDPMSAYVEIRKALIYREDGSTEEIDISKTLDYPAPARMIYWGARQKMLEIGKLEPGDAVEVEMFRKGFTYALLQNNEDDDSKYIPPMKGHFYDIINFWVEHPTKIKYYEVNIPNDKFVQYKFYNGNPDSTIIKGQEKTKFAFTLKEIFPMQKEPHMVNLSDVAPKLLISTSPDWESKSMWFYGVNEDYGSFKSTPDIYKKVTEILIGAKDELDSISKLTHWVADNMRYSGISMGEGEGYTLHNGEMNFRDRCGVCKDKAGMLVTLLRAAGFESYAAMTMAGSRIDRIPADQFNHSVTVVKMRNGEYKMLDPTWVPFVRELWSSREQQQNYLMGLPQGADLMEIPLSPPENHYFKINGSSEIYNDGSLIGEFTLTAEGQSDAAVRSIFTRSYKSDWKKSLEAELLKIFPLIEISELKFPVDPYDYSEPINIAIKYKIPDFAIVTDQEIIFIPVISSNLFKNIQAHLHFDTSVEKRDYPFRDQCSRLIELNETITLPKETEAIYIPSEEKHSGSGADYSGSITLSGKILQISQKASFKKRIYQPEDWESYRNAVKSQNKFSEEKIILKLR